MGQIIKISKHVTQMKNGFAFGSAGNLQAYDPYERARSAVFGKEFVKLGVLQSGMGAGFAIRWNHRIAIRIDLCFSRHAGRFRYFNQELAHAIMFDGQFCLALGT